MELVDIDKSRRFSAEDGEDFIPRRQHKLLVTVICASFTIFCDAMLCLPSHPALSARHIKYVTVKGQCTTVFYFLVC